MVDPKITPTEVIQQLMVPGMAGLAAAVVAIWRAFREQIKALKESNEECKENYEKVQTEVKQLNRDFGYIKGKQEGVELLAERVIREVRATRK